MNSSKWTLVDIVGFFLFLPFLIFECAAEFYEKNFIEPAREKDKETHRGAKP